MSLHETEGLNETVNKQKMGLDLIENGEVKEEIVNDNSEFKKDQRINDEKFEENNSNIEETFKEIKEKLKNLNQKEKIRPRTDILFNLHRKIVKHREDIQYKSEIEKEHKELSECTFMPKILKINSNFKKQFNNVEIKNIANENYVEKKKKHREKQNQLDHQSKNKVGTGHNWTKDLTVPKDFDFKTQGNIIIPSNLNNSEINEHPTDKNVKVKLSA
jgi:hypothetical protein